MRVLIIDDEALARKIIKDYLKDLEDVEIVGECQDGFEGIKAIAELKPDVIFLDVQMPKLNGFEMLELLDELPSIIFTTAFDKYAVKAFENNAADYLMKPFSKERLLDALEKVKQNDKDNRAALKGLSPIDTNDLIDRIAVKTGTKIRIIYTDEIQYLESQDDYVMLYTPSGKHLKQKTMKYFENHLPPDAFVRIHRSYMVKIDFIDQIELYEKDAYIIRLKNNQILPVSKKGYTRLREVLNF